jgi:hypothetical protein
MTAYGLASNRSRPRTGRRRWTAPQGGWAARRCSGPPSARQRARLDAVPCLSSLPPRGAHGRHRRCCALPVPRIAVTPNPPCEGVLPLAARTRRAPGQARSPVARYIARFSQVDIRTAWRAAVAGPACAEGQEAHARAGRGAGVGWRAAWGQRVPTPRAGRCAPL